MLHSLELNQNEEVFIGSTKGPGDVSPLKSELPYTLKYLLS